MNRFDPPEAGYKGIAGRGALLMGISQACRIACQILSVIILARLLTPYDFGIYAMAWPVFAFIGMFQNIGFSQALVQKPKLEEGQVNALFWIGMAVNLGLTLFFLICAPLAGWFYRQPEVVPLIAAMAFIFLAQGMGIQAEALLNRKMSFGIIAFVGASNAVVTLLTAILVSLFIPSYWALFWGSLAGCLWSNMWYLLSARWWPSLPRRLSQAFDMMRFGAGVTVFNFANFVERNIDNVLIGRHWGSVQLGLYDRGYKLLLFPLQAVTAPIGKVMIPVLSRLTNEPARYRQAYLRAVRLMVLLITPGIVFLLVMADFLIPFLMGEKWQGIVPIFQALAFAGFLQPINNSGGWLFVSQGRGRDFAMAGVISGLFTGAAILFGLPFGIVGVAVAYAASEFFKSPFLWWLSTKSSAVKYSDLSVLTGFHLLLAILTALAVYSCKQYISLPDFWMLTAAGCLSYGIFIVLLSLFCSGRETLTEAWSLVKDHIFIAETRRKTL